MSDLPKKGSKIDVAEYNTPASKNYEAYKALIEAYKAQNPAKYELKKAALEARLAALKN